MRHTALFIALMTAGAVVGSATADGLNYDNPDVVKLPAPPGEHVLLYPGGQYGRVVPDGLKQPGTDYAPVHLHPIHLHRLGPNYRHHQAMELGPALEPAESAPAHKTTPVTEARLAPVHLKKPGKPHKAAPAPRLAQAAPAPRPAAKAAAKPVTHQAVKKLAAVTPKASPAPQKPRTEPPRTKKIVRVARAEPPRQIKREMARPHLGLHKAQIPFARSATQPAGDAIATINALAQSLNGAVGGRKRVQILAYAGAKGNKTSSARRLSLKRALIVRQLLIDGGVPSERIDVRAMGGVTDNGAPERVDIFLKN